MIYARVDNDTVVEYPVFPQHIEARGHRVDMYTHVKTVDIPKYDDNVFNLSESMPVFYDGVLTQVYKLIPCTPKSITPRQARLKLLEMGLLDKLEAIITTNRAWQIEWEYATEVKRDSPLIDAVAVQAGLTDTQIDTMFIEASKL